MAVSEAAYERPIIELLNEHNGRLHIREMKQHMPLRVKLRQDDWVICAAGVPLWVNRMAWQRKKLVEQGILRSDSPRGWWELARPSYCSSLSPEIMMAVEALVNAIRADLKRH